MAAARSEHEMNLRKDEDDQHGEEEATPSLPIRISVKNMEDLLYLLIGLHPHGHHGQELTKLDCSIIVLKILTSWIHLSCFLLANKLYWFPPSPLTNIKTSQVPCVNE